MCLYSWSWLYNTLWYPKIYQCTIDHNVSNTKTSDLREIFFYALTSELWLGEFCWRQRRLFVLSKRCGQSNKEMINKQTGLRLLRLRYKMEFIWIFKKKKERKKNERQNWLLKDSQNKKKKVLDNRNRYSKNENRKLKRMENKNVTEQNGRMWEDMNDRIHYFILFYFFFLSSRI